jgi:hypothetical protein
MLFFPLKKCRVGRLLRVYTGACTEASAFLNEKLRNAMLLRQNVDANLLVDPVHPEVPETLNH